MAHDNILRMNLLLFITLIFVGFCSSSLTIPLFDVDEIEAERNSLPLHIHLIEIPTNNIDEHRLKDPWRKLLWKSLQMKMIDQQQNTNNEKRLASQAFHAMRG